MPVLLAIAGVILLILLIPLVVEIRVRDSLTVHLRIFWFIRISVYPPKKEQKGPRKTPEKPSPEKDLLKQIADYREILVDLFGAVRGLLKRVHLRRLNLRIMVTGGEPHETALLHGAVCAVVYPMLAAVSALMRFNPAKKVHSVRITPDFDAKEQPPRIRMTAVCTILPAAILGAGIRFLILAAKVKASPASGSAS